MSKSSRASKDRLKNCKRREEVREVRHEVKQILKNGNLENLDYVEDFKYSAEGERD